MEHVHLPQRDNPDHCAYDQCGLIWSDPVHAPSVALRKLQEAAPDLRPLEQHERASGAPFVPSQRREATAEDAAKWVNNAAPATHTGRPSMHSGGGPEYSVPADARWIMCPMSSRPNGGHRVRCAFTSPMKSEMADHLHRVHDYGQQAAGFYLAHPWYANEARSEWVKRTEHLRGSHLLANKTQTPDPVPAFKHNGITTEFHKCDATDVHEPHMWRPGERTEWFTCRGDLTPDEEDEGLYTRPIGCPVREREIEEGVVPSCGGRAGHTKGTIRRHLQTVHQWTGDMWDDWAESVNFLELPIVPPEVLKFFNPDVTMEQIMTDANAANAMGLDGPEEPVNEHRLDPRELEQILTGWWMGKATDEVMAVVPKAVEYGATDLRDMGRVMAEMAGRVISDEEATELGIYFYALGKMSRWSDAIKRGERVSDDTLHDLGVYVRMVQRTRDAGGWPGLPKD